MNRPTLTLTLTAHPCPCDQCNSAEGVRMTAGRALCPYCVALTGTGAVVKVEGN